jgi:hypothetical protein
MATQPLQHDSHQARQHSLLIATTDPGQRTFLAGQLDADGHTVYEADTTTGALTALSRQPATCSCSASCNDQQTPPRSYEPCVPASTRGSTRACPSSPWAPATS